LYTQALRKQREFIIVNILSRYVLILEKVIAVFMQ